MRRIHSGAIAFALAEPLLISKFENASVATGADELRRPTDKESFVRTLGLLRNQVANGVPQRCANQNECDAARGCGA